MIFNHIELSFHPVFPLKFSKLNILKHQKQEILIPYYSFFSIQLFFIRISLRSISIHFALISFILNSSSPELIDISHKTRRACALNSSSCTAFFSPLNLNRLDRIGASSIGIVFYRGNVRYLAKLEQK